LNNSFAIGGDAFASKGPLFFALVETAAAPQHNSSEHCLELVPPTCERLRIGTGVDVATLRTVLEACTNDSPSRPAFAFIYA
jgi:hypothetical protein